MHQAHGGARLTLRLLFTVALIAMPMAVQALGLGRLTVHSGLDEPFNGQIELISPSAQEIKTLKAALASRADFDIAGVERNAFLFDITYTVRQHPNGQYYLKLATHNPVREPFLHFLIQVDWSGGHLIREYSALLDPPQWVAGAAAEINVPATSVPEVAPVVEVAPVAEVAPIEELPPLGTVTEPQAEAVAAEKPQLAAGEPAAVPAEAPVATPAEVPAATQVESIPAPAAASAEVEPFIPSTAPIASEPAPAVVSELAPAPVAEMPAAAGVSTGVHEYGPVKPGETLGVVASKINSDRELTSQQVMLALLRANPSAFFGNNVNNLKAGKILTVPEREAIAAVPKAQAAKEFRAQYDAWQEYKLKLAGASRAVAVAEIETPKTVAKPETKKAGAKKPEKTAKAGKAGKNKSAASGKAVPVDLLKIVRANLEQEIPEESTKTPGVETKKDAGKEQRALTERVATLEEAIESKQMQNKEMRERVGKLQEQVKNTERLVELENKDIALAQKQAAEKQAAEAKAAAEKAAQEKIAQEKVAQDKAAKGKAAADAAKAAQAAKPAEAPKPAGEAAPAKKPAVAAKPAPAPVVPEENLLDGILTSVMDNPLLLALLGALGVLGAGVGGMYAYRRRRASQEFSESILSSSSLSSEASITDGSGQAAASDTSFLSDFSQGGMGNIHTDEVDPIAEAEVYLAYGRDEQAEEILKDAIVKDPARQELKGKLLEIYFQRNDVAGFETLAEELYAALEGKGGKVWDKAEEMGQKLSPNNPMFRGGKPAARGSAGPTTRLVNEPPAAPYAGSEHTLETMLSTQGLETSPAPAPSSGLDFNMDFDASPAKTSEAPAEPSFDMSFDMGAGTAPSASRTAESTSSFDMDFNIGAPETADTSSNLIDFNTSGTQELTSGLDFSTSGGSPAAGGDVEFSLGGMGDSVAELDSAPAGAAAEGGLPGWDETATKLDLAKAYIDMGDAEGARSILDEVMTEGNDNQKQQARSLAAQIAA